MRLHSFLIPLLILFGCNSQEPASSNEKITAKVLIICTSESTFNGHTNGTYMQEVAIPLYEFHQKGIDVDIISPSGGAIPIYHKFDTTEALQTAIESSYYQNKIQHSKTLADINIEEYAAIVIPGGYGQFNDLHASEPIKNLIVSHYEGGGLIGSLGHGTALLAQLKLSDGSYLVDGVSMTCFPNWNEQNIMVESDKGKLLPFLMESELIKNGANLKIYDHEKKINHEIIDEDKRIVTAAFASGGDFVANEIMALMGVDATHTTPQ